MYDRYTCPLQPCRHWTWKLFIQGHSRSAKELHRADFKSASISLIIGPRGLTCIAYRKSWAWNLLMWTDFTLDPSFKVKQGKLNLKKCLELFFYWSLELSNMKPTYRKSLAGNLSMYVVRFDLGYDPSRSNEASQNLKCLELAYYWP